ncbi:serine hydrolase domain-containing protein [Streptomyces microflavus]|uniref:serine hydrolase domain-containing protein n=1 Tax=Streptomyces microflavus TaxID=1919 RepID=UPI00340FA0AE
MTGRVHGSVHTGFAAVRDVLSEHLSAGLDLGFSFCAYHRGEVVADLWGGHVDVDRRLDWLPTTLLPLTSITKTVLTTTLWRLAELGDVDIEAPVSSYWREFGANGKADITVATVMSHRAGIPAFPDPITLADELEWWPVVRKIQNLSPLWKPGEAHGYHAIVLGFLTSELIRRVTGAPASAAVRTHVIDPLGIDLHMSLSSDDTRRLAEVLPPSDDQVPEVVPAGQREYVAGFVDQDSLLYRATFGSTAMTFKDMNNPAYHSTERPAAYGNAHAVAKMFAALVSDIPEGRLLSPRSVRMAALERSSGMDEVFRLPTRWAGGFMLPGGPLWPDFGRPAFGHIGSTGALAFADPEYEFSFAFLPNKMKSVYEVPDRRAQALIRTCYAALEGM